MSPEYEQPQNDLPKIPTPPPFHHTEPLYPPVDPPTEEPLPPYQPHPAPVESTAPTMVVAVSPLTREHLNEIENQSRLPSWWVITAAVILLWHFSTIALVLIYPQSVTATRFTGICCLLAGIGFVISLVVGNARRRREMLLLGEYVTRAQETAGVIEVYPDRVIRITPHTRTVVNLRSGQTTVWEAPTLLTVSDGYAAITLQAQDVTPVVLEELRQQIYPAIKPEHRKSRGRMIATAFWMPPLPEIETSEEMLYEFSYLPNARKEQDRKTLLKSLKIMPFNGVTAVIVGGIAAALFGSRLSHAMNLILFALMAFVILQGLSTAIIFWVLRSNSLPESPIQLAITLEGLAVEEGGCLRFIPHGWYQYYLKRECLVLHMPVGSLYIPWSDIPDPEMVKRLLMLGD